VGLRAGLDTEVRRKILLPNINSVEAESRSVVSNNASYSRDIVFESRAIYGLSGLRSAWFPLLP
jgi:hypothetical protein